MPRAWQRSTSTVIASIDLFQSVSTGLPRLIRYELCATGSTTPVSASARRKAATWASVSVGAFHWLLFLVNSCTVRKPTACAARTARSHPPAIDMCAPILAGMLGILSRPVGRLPRSFIIPQRNLAEGPGPDLQSGQVSARSFQGRNHRPGRGFDHGLDHLGGRPADL